MSAPDPHCRRQTWLIAYDIRHPRRLGRVHSLIRRHASPLQYSLFLYQGQRQRLDELIEQIEHIINPREDDVWLCRLRGRQQQFWQLGRAGQPDGNTIVSATIQDYALDRQRQQRDPEHRQSELELDFELF